MAVKVPTPPVPPTPPTVPGVTLSEGGSVTQSDVPPANGTTSRSIDTEKQMEEQARAAVAQGSGALSRTTQKDPAAEAKAAKAAAREAQQSGQKQAQAAVDSGRNQAAQAADMGGTEAASRDGGKAQPGQAVETASLQADPAPRFDYQGLAYWLPMLLVAFVAAAFLVKKILHRKGRKGELTKADLEADALGAVENRELRGLTPDEVLARLEAKERPLPRKTPKKTVKPKEPLPAVGKVRKDPVPARDASAEGERKHFEVRI